MARWVFLASSAWTPMKCLTEKTKTNNPKSNNPKTNNIVTRIFTMTELNAEFLKALYLVSISAGVFTFLNLLVCKGERRIHTTLLIFVSLLLVSPLNAYLQLVVDSPPSWLTIISQNLTWAYGPLLLLTVQFTLLKEPSKAIIALHLLPCVLANIYRLSGGPLSGHPPYFYQVLFLQSFIYSTYSAYCVIKNRQRYKLLLANHGNSTYYWLSFLSLGLLALTLLDITIFNFMFNGMPINFLISTIPKLKYTVH